jgi:hypothetical protein
MSELVIEVLINGCFGGFVLSDKVCDLYNQRKIKKLGEDDELSPHCEVDRSDPILLKIFHEIGSDNFSGLCSCISIKTIPKKYQYFYSIDEYDGMESIKINHEQYVIDKFESILDSDMSNDDKILELQKNRPEKRGPLFIR